MMQVEFVDMTHMSPGQTIMEAITTPIGFSSVDSYQEGTTPLGNDADGMYYEGDGNGSIDYSELVQESAFLGDYPFDVILEGIREQFTDYINIEDKTNYVDVFYESIKESYRAVRENDEEEHPIEIIEALDRIKDQFISEIYRLFESRLTISIMVVDDETTEEDEVELAIRKMYEFFILGARDRFKTVIAAGLIPKLEDIEDDQEFFSKVDELLMDYDPLVTACTPTEFLQLCKDEDILSMYEDGQVSGNFLRKYSAKLYQNDGFKVDVTNHIILLQSVKEEIIHG